MISNPYPGLRPFQHHEAAIFFGREQETQEVMAQLIAKRFMAVLGSSGCGKSSLARAGVVAALEKDSAAQNRSRWWVGKMRPGESPLRQLAQALIRPSLLEKPSPELAAADVEVDEGVLACLRQGEEGLTALLRQDGLPDNTNFLLLIDQFEELFQAYRHGNRREAEAFVALIAHSVRQREFPIYVLTTMRSEFVGECSLFSGLSELLNASFYLVPPMTREQLFRAITEPAKICGGEIEASMLTRLLDETTQEPDRLPLLQHCLMRIWFRATSGKYASDAQQETKAPTARKSGRIMLNLEEYFAVGGVLNALSNHADQTFWKLLPRQQPLAAALFRRLGDRRAKTRYVSEAVPIREIAEIAGVSVQEVIDIVEVFRHPECHFLTPEIGVPLTADTAVALSHDSLLRNWRQLREWVEQEAKSAETYRYLRQTAYLWEQGKAALWKSPDLERALLWKEQERPNEAWARRYGGDFAITMTFLQRSAARKNSRHRLMLAGLLALGILLSGAGVWGGLERFWRLRAQRELTAAQEQASRNAAELQRLNAVIAEVRTQPQAAAAMVAIRELRLQDARGLTVTPLQERYLLKPGEQVTVALELDNPLQREVETRFYHFLEKKTVTDAAYVTPNLPGAKDLLMIQVVEKATGDVIAQALLPIQIAATITR